MMAADPADVGWGHHAQVLRSGDHLFVSNTLGVGADGRIVQHWDDLPPEGKALKSGKRHLDLREGPLAAQTWQIFQNLGALLEAHGSSLAGICKMQIFLTNKKLFPFFERVRMRLLEGQQPPSSCIEVQQVDPSGEACVAIDVVAAAVGPRGRELERVFLHSGQQNLGVYAPGTATAEHLYLAGIIPIDPESNHIVVGFDDLPDRGAALRDGQVDVDYWDGPIAAQTWDVHRQIERLLTEQGLTFDDVVRLVVYLRHLRDFPAFERIHRQRFPRAEQPVTVVQVTDVGSTSDIVIEIDVVAARPGAGRNGQPRKLVLPAPPGVVARSRDAQAVQSGSLVFLGGRVALDRDGTGIVRTPDSLPTDVRAAVRSWSKVAPRLQSVACQTAAILSDMRAILQPGGFSLGQVRKLHVFLTDFGDWVAVNETLRAFFPEQPPAVSVVQVPAVGPGRGATVMIDGIATV